MVSSAFASEVSGVPAPEVFTMSSEPSAFLTSQVQPEPKLPTAEVLNAFLNSSKLPHLASMAAARAPVGAPPAIEHGAELGLGAHARRTRKPKAGFRPESPCQGIRCRR